MVRRILLVPGHRMLPSKEVEPLVRDAIDVAVRVGEVDLAEVHARNGHSGAPPRWDERHFGTERLSQANRGRYGGGVISRMAMGKSNSGIFATNGFGSNASGPRTPAPFHSPSCSSSIAMTGPTA